jgi:hypothetical protein
MTHVLFKTGFPNYWNWKKIVLLQDFISKYKKKEKGLIMTNTSGEKNLSREIWYFYMTTSS